MAVMLWMTLFLLFLPTAARAQPADCSTVGQTLFVRDVFNELYYLVRAYPRG